MSDPVELARMAAEISASTSSRRDLADARARWLAHGTRRASPRPALRFGRAIAIVAATACLVVLVGLWRWQSPVPGLSYVFGDPPRPAEVGQWVAADEAAASLRFSDGSTVALSPGSRARVTSTAPDGAEVLIERGQLDADIWHVATPRSWRFRGGPFVVHVVGTSFTASWDPSREILTLAVREGAVRVEGPLLPPDRMVVAGERLLVSLPDQRMELVSASSAAILDAAPSLQSASPAEMPSQAASSADAAPSVALGTDAPPSSAHAPGSFRELVRQGKSKEAMRALSDTEFAGVVAGASASELLTLSDAARLGGRPDRARQALLAARKKGARGQSAFLLGKISADQLSAPGEAVGWFELYLSEQPSGPLAEQALGRVVELSRSSKKKGRAAAERYLAAYPNGAYAALARSIVAE